KVGSWIRWIVWVPGVDLATAKLVLGDDLKRQHVAHVEDDARWRGVFIQDPRRVREGPYFGCHCLNYLPDEVVRLPRSLAGTGRGRTILETQLTRVRNIGKLKIYQLALADPVGVPNGISVPCELPSAQRPRESGVQWLVMNRDIHKA